MTIERQLNNRSSTFPFLFETIIAFDLSFGLKRTNLIDAFAPRILYIIELYNRTCIINLGKLIKKL